MTGSRVRALLRYARLIGALTLAAGVLGFAIASLAPPTYQTSVDLIWLGGSVNSTAGEKSNESLSRLKNYAPLVKSDAVLRDAIGTKSVQSETIEQLRRNVRVIPGRESSSFLLTIYVASSDPSRAADIANSIAEVFVQRVMTVETTLQEADVSNLNASIKRLTETLKGLDAQIAAWQSLEPSPSGDPVTRLLNNSVRQQTLALLLQSREPVAEHLDLASSALGLLEARQREGVVIWDRAVPPNLPEGPSPRLIGVLSAAVAFSVAVSVALLIDILRPNRVGGATSVA
jgi:capsular polysaccharide biosynthesis protein